VWWGVCGVSTRGLYVVLLVRVAVGYRALTHTPNTLTDVCSASGGYVWLYFCVLQCVAVGYRALTHTPNTPLDVCSASSGYVWLYFCVLQCVATQYRAFIHVPTHRWMREHAPHTSTRVLVVC